MLEVFGSEIPVLVGPLATDLIMPLLLLEGSPLLRILLPTVRDVGLLEAPLLSSNARRLIASVSSVSPAAGAFGVLGVLAVSRVSGTF